MAVYLNREPRSVFLATWGQHNTGWWGCITFHARITGDGEPELRVACWVPAHAVRKAEWAAPEKLPRIQLPVDRRAWPAPPGWPSWFAGVWVDGPLPLPHGVELVHGAAWRNKPPRSTS